MNRLTKEIALLPRPLAHAALESSSLKPPIPTGPGSLLIAEPPLTLALVYSHHSDTSTRNAPLHTALSWLIYVTKGEVWSFAIRTSVRFNGGAVLH